MVSEPVQAERELERRHSESVSGQAAVHESSFSSLSHALGAFGAAGAEAGNSKLMSSPLVQRSANDAVRAVVTRRVQQLAGNQRTQQLVAQFRRETVVQRQCACGGTCAACRETEATPDSGEEEQGVVQRQAEGGTGEVSGGLIPADSPGQPLDASTRGQMEDHFGGDLSDVRIHADAAAGESAIALQARAYTAGQDVYFAPGQYQPQSRDGSKLLAHELTHTRQQAAGETPSEMLASRNGSVAIGAADDPLEHEAEENAEAFAAGESAAAVKPDSEGAVRRDSNGWSLTNNPITNAVAGGVEAAGEFIGNTIEHIAPGATKFFHGLREYFDDALGKGVDGLFGGILSSIKEKGIAGTLESVIGSAAGGILKAAGSFIAGKCAAMGELAEHLVDLAAKLGGAALEQVKKGFDLIKGVLEDLWNQYGAPAVDWVKNKLKAVWKVVEDTARRFWDWLKPLRDRVAALWDKVTNFLIEGRRKFEDWLEAVVKKGLDAWDALKVKLKPHMEQVKTGAKVAGVVSLLLSPLGPIVIAGGAVYLLYLGVKAFWDKWGKPAAQSVRQWWADQALPYIEKKIGELKEKIESAAQQIRHALQELYDVFMKVLDAAGVLSFLVSVKAAIQSMAAKIEAFKEKIDQKLQEWAQKIGSLLAAAQPYLQQIREFLRQTLVVALLGPLAFLDDGVWKTMNTMVSLAMRTPCLRELAGLLRIPALLARLGPVRDGIKRGWETIRNPGPLLQQMRAAIQPLVDKIEPAVRARVDGLLAGYTEREIFIQLSILHYLADSLKHLSTSWWDDLKRIGKSLLWPWDDVGKEFMPMLSAFGEAISALFDLEISKAIDSFLDGMKKFNGIAGALSGWFTLASVLIGATLGALGFAFGPAGVATVGAGATAGLEFAESVGFVLLIITLVTEAAVIQKSQFDLQFQNPRIADKDERDKADQEDCKAIAGSLISLITIGALMVLADIASRFAKFLYGLVEDVPLVRDIAELLKAAKQKVGDFSFKKGGKPGEGATPGGGLDDAAAKLEEKGVPRAQFERELNQIREKAADPNNVRQPADPRYDAEVEVKDGAETHTYDRNKADRTACRDSEVKVCGLDLGSDVNSELDKALEQKAGEKGKGAPAGEELTAEEAALMQRPDVQQLMDRIEDNGLPVNEKELLDYIAPDPEARIAGLNADIDKAIDIREDIAGAQKAVGEGAKVDVPSRETGTEGLQVKHAHDIGVEKGREAAQALDKLKPSGWVNPLEHRGGFGQGFDDIMLKPNGDPVIVEYKGGSAELGTGQLSREWVQRNIDLLREAGDNAMADKLQAALDTGKLEARVYRTPLDTDGKPLPTMRDVPITYPPKAPATPVAQPSRDNPSAEAEDGFAAVETSGEPLDAQTRGDMERRLDHEFGGVQVHTDAAAGASAAALHADAYAVGRDLYFAPGMYNPATAEGRGLIAHELAHTRQHDQGHVPAAVMPRNGNGMAVTRAGDPFECEAERAAEGAGGGRPLEPASLEFMQSRFAIDLGGIRIHDDADAAGWARARNAQAFTVGRDVYFAAGKYAPATADGQRLLAHEVAHTIQQSGARGDYAAQAYPESPAAGLGSREERQAEMAAAAAVSGALVPTETLLRSVPALKAQLQNEPTSKDIYPDPIDVVWGGDPFHITYSRGTENAQVFLEFVVEYIGSFPIDSKYAKDRTVRVRAGISPNSTLNASLRSKGPSSISIDLYGWGDRIVHLQDHVTGDAAKGREHDFSVRDIGRTESGPSLWVRDPNAGPIAKPEAPALQEDVPGQLPESYLVGGGATELRIDGDGDQMKELRVLLKATSYWPKTDVADRVKEIHLSIMQISSRAERVFDFEVPAALDQGALIPMVKQVTDGRIPTGISLFHSPDSPVLSIWPPTRDDKGVSYTVQVPGNVVAFNFPPEKGPLRQVASADQPGWSGGIAYLDFVLGPYADFFRLTVQSTAKLENKGAATAIIGLTGLYHGQPTGGAFGIEMTVDHQPVLKVLDSSSVSLKVDIDGNPAHALEIFDQLTTLGSERDPERKRYHYVRVVSQVLGDRVFYFSVMGGGAPRGDVAQPSEADVAAESNARAVSGLLEQAAVPDFDLELDSLDAIAFAAVRRYAVSQKIIQQKTYDDWKAFSDARIQLRPMINAKQADPGLKAQAAAKMGVLKTLAAAKMGEFGADLAADIGSPWILIAAMTVQSQIVTESWEHFDSGYRALMERVDDWIVDRLKTVRGEHADETKQAQLLATRKAEMAKLADKKPIRVRAVFDPDEPIAVRGQIEGIKEVPLALYLFQELYPVMEEGKLDLRFLWVLRDLSNPEKPYDYGPRAGAQPPIELFQEMDDPDHMPPGRVHFEVPGMYGGQVRVTHHLTVKQALSYAAMAAALVGITLVSFGTATGAASIALYGGYALSASTVAAALVAGIDIAQGLHHGDLDIKRVVMDLGQIVAAVAGIAQLRSGLILSEARTAAQAGRLTAAMQEYAVFHQKLYVVSNLVRGAADLTTLLVFEKTLYDQLVAIDRNPGGDEDKFRARWLLLAQLAGGVAMMTLAVDGMRPSQLGGGRQLMLQFPIEGAPPVANIGGEVAPASLTFGHRAVEPAAGGSTTLETLDELAESMRQNGWQGPALDVVELPDGTMVSTDNRRLLAAQKAGLKKIPVAIHSADEAFAQGRPGAGAGEAGGVENSAIKLQAEGVPREQFQRELNQLRRKAADPHNVHQPAEPGYDAEIGVEEGAERHRYDRDKIRRTWCRHSDGEICDLDLGSEVNSEVDEAEKNIPGKKAAGAPAEKRLTAEEAGLRQRPDVQALLERIEEQETGQGLVATEEEILRYIAPDPTKRIAELNRAMDIRESIFPEAESGVKAGEKVDIPSHETGTRGLEVRAAHDIGVEKGKEAAVKLDKLKPSNWVNPLDHRGGFGQGFDDIMYKPNGDPVVVEYKGGSAELATDQLSREWVQRNIDKLRKAGDHAMADKLQSALDAGKLEGRVYRTPIDANGNALPTMRDVPIRYAPKP